MIINGKKLAKKIYDEIKGELEKLPYRPGLGVILVGGNKASKIYVALKEKKAKELKIFFLKHTFKNNASIKDILAAIKKFNANDAINGILIQAPLPKHLNSEKVFNQIMAKKDVDGFLKNSPVVSPPILATIESLKFTRVILKNKKAALLVNSKIFGNILKENLNKEFWLSSKVFLPQKEDWNFVKKSEVVICARGNPHFLKADDIQEGVILIDIGITRIGDKVLGDISPTAQKKSLFYTPVPGGIGPLTIAFLFKNLVYLSKTQCPMNNPIAASSGVSIC